VELLGSTNSSSSFWSPQKLAHPILTTGFTPNNLSLRSTGRGSVWRAYEALGEERL
jgi:hypothetical protein